MLVETVVSFQPMEISTQPIQTEKDQSASNNNKFTPTIQQLIEQKEKRLGAKKRKLFDYDDEW